MRKYISEKKELRKYIWNDNSVKWGNSAIRDFHYRDRSYYLSDEVRCSRYIYMAEFQDKVLNTTGIVRGMVIFFTNTEGYVEQLTLEIHYPRFANLKLIELDEDDIAKIIPEVDLKFDDRAYLDDIIREIRERKERESQERAWKTRAGHGSSGSSPPPKK